MWGRSTAHLPRERGRQPGVVFGRVTTAIRTFTLALAAGSTLSAGTFGEALPLFSALVLIAFVSTALEWGPTVPALSWVPVGEVVLAAILLASTPAPDGLLVYLAAPPLAAGVRHGLVSVLNAALVGCLATLVTLAVGPSVGDRPHLTASLIWLVTGLGMGLLASWQSRSARELQGRQAPHATAHHLVAQLHGLTRRGGLDLDSRQLADELIASVRSETGSSCVAVFVDSMHTPHLVASYGDHQHLTEALRLDPTKSLPQGIELLPLRGSGDTLGAVVLCRPEGWSASTRARAQRLVDDYALPISTAFLFEGVRSMATAEERSRIAREMHDGVAQEIVALGYVVDEIESVSAEPEIREMATSLREEITRVVTELRLSIFDLRQDVSDHLSGAIADYVRATCGDTGIEAHLSLNESGPPLPVKTQVELLRVAQEAIGNIRRHSGATNLWVRLVTDGTAVTLEVSDDGIGKARPRERHWGLQTMKERAAAIGADLSIHDRDGGGTRVLLESRAPSRKELTS